jgi:uncharacterized protein (DUF427 family)
MSNSGPGYQKNPDHTCALAPEKRRVVVRFGGEVIADSRDALTMHETNHGPVFYVPRKDVKMELLTRTEHHTYCPYKGQASYFSLTGARTSENAVWTYETPYDEVMAIKDHVAFYPDRVDAIAAE